MFLASPWFYSFFAIIIPRCVNAPARFSLSSESFTDQAVAIIGIISGASRRIFVRLVGHLPTKPLAKTGDVAPFGGESREVGGETGDYSAGARGLSNSDSAGVIHDVCFCGLGAIAKFSG